MVRNSFVFMMWLAVSVNLLSNNVPFRQYIKVSNFLIKEIFLSQPGFVTFLSPNSIIIINYKNRDDFKWRFSAAVVCTIQSPWNISQMSLKSFLSMWDVYFWPRAVYILNCVCMSVRVNRARRVWLKIIVRSWCWLLQASHLSNELHALACRNIVELSVVL